MIRSTQRHIRQLDTASENILEGLLKANLAEASEHFARANIKQLGSLFTDLASARSQALGLNNRQPVVAIQQQME